MGNVKAFFKDTSFSLRMPDILSIAAGIVVGLEAHRCVMVVWEDVVLPFTFALLPIQEAGLTTLGFWRFRFPLGHLFGSVISSVFIATAGVLIARAFLKRLGPKGTRTCDACKEQVHLDATKCKFCSSDLASRAL